MRLFYSAVLAIAMAGFACSPSSSSSGDDDEPSGGYETVDVLNCTEKAMNVFSRNAQSGGEWSHHGDTSSAVFNGKCDKGQAMAGAVNVDLGEGPKLVRAILWDFNSSCDSMDPNGLCPKRDHTFSGDPDGPSTEWSVTYP